MELSALFYARVCILTNWPLANDSQSLIFVSHHSSTSSWRPATITTLTMHLLLQCIYPAVLRCTYRLRFIAIHALTMDLPCLKLICAYHAHIPCTYFPCRALTMHLPCTYQAALTTMHLPCTYYDHALTIHLPCSYHARTMHSPLLCTYHALSMHVPGLTRHPPRTYYALPCAGNALTAPMHLLCTVQARTMHLPYLCTYRLFAMHVPCTCHACATRLPCTYHEHTTHTLTINPMR
jgi:hypothetical protein